jgi:DUF4097 and DUF4098 domain-containing protein YvlB
MIERTFETPGHVTLDLRIPHGSIELRTVDGAETHVELDARGQIEAVQEFLEDARVEVRETGDGHEVRVVGETRAVFGFRFWRSLDVRLDVTAPHGAGVRVETGSADTRGRGRFGSVEAKVGSGDVYFEEVEGAAAVKTGSGDVQLRRVAGDVAINSGSGDVQIESLAGQGTIRSASGDVVVREAAGGLTVQTASGDQQIGSVAEGDVTLQSASGDIAVGVRRGSRLWVDARSMSGDTNSDLEVSDVQVDDEGPLVELRATAMSGDISVTRA